MKKFFKSAFGFVLTTARYALFIWMMYLKTENAIPPKVENLVPVGLALATIWLTVVMVMVMMGSHLMNKTLDYFDKPDFAKAMGRVLANAVGGKTLEEHRHEEDDARQQIERIAKVERGCLSKMREAFFVVLMTTFIVYSAMAGYIKTAMYLTLVEFIILSNVTALWKHAKRAQGLLDAEQAKIAASIGQAQSHCITDTINRIKVDARRMDR